MYDELHRHNFEGRTGRKASHFHNYSGVTTKNPDLKAMSTTCPVIQLRKTNIFTTTQY